METIDRTVDQKDVKFIHYRTYEATEGGKFRYFNKGGITIAYTLQPDGTTKLGAAFCNLQDNFNRKVGRDLSLERLQKNNLRVTLPEDATKRDFRTALLKALRDSGQKVSLLSIMANDVLIRYAPIA